MKEFVGNPMNILQSQIQVLELTRERIRGLEPLGNLTEEEKALVNVGINMSIDVVECILSGRRDMEKEKNRNRWSDEMGREL